MPVSYLVRAPDPPVTSSQLPPDATQARHSQRVNKMTTPNRDAQVRQAVPQPSCVEDRRVAVRAETDPIGRAQVSTGEPRSTRTHFHYTAPGDLGSAFSLARQVAVSNRRAKEK